MRGVEETEEERAARPMTRGEAVNWYRSGGQHLVEQEAEVASLSGNWKQFHLMTRGRQEPRDEDQVPSARISTPITLHTTQVPTRSENLHWYRSGGCEAVAARDQLVRDSSTWLQYKLTRWGMVRAVLGMISMMAGTALPGRMTWR